MHDQENKGTSDMFALVEFPLVMYKDWGNAAYNRICKIAERKGETVNDYILKAITMRQKADHDLG